MVLVKKVCVAGGGGSGEGAGLNADSAYIFQSLCHNILSV